MKWRRVKGGRFFVVMSLILQGFSLSEYVEFLCGLENPSSDTPFPLVGVLVGLLVVHPVVEISVHHGFVWPCRVSLDGFNTLWIYNLRKRFLDYSLRVAYFGEPLQ